MVGIDEIDRIAHRRVVDIGLAVGIGAHPALPGLCPRPPEARADKTERSGQRRKRQRAGTEQQGTADGTCFGAGHWEPVIGRGVA
ncbi:hypothetical protein BLTE_19630 [Blastochloris tepida]|uniref:Uncharacterized protein n=1 Tax=Blastochloris tepida TaxID=2233851 RepID=A0A348G145_9HYPH|nr:hypothetical protein BLTE_19630 [Blastochloris tepida]